MKVIISPQSFKGSVSAMKAARAIERGVRVAAPDAETVLVPVADGGDGTLDALVESTGGKFFKSIVTGPLGRRLEANWGVMGDGQTAVIEMALASGLALVPPKSRDPRITTTRGTGEIIKEALDRGFNRIIVGLGGSATNDAGVGMAGAEAILADVSDTVAVAVGLRRIELGWTIVAVGRKDVRIGISQEIEVRLSAVGPDVVAEVGADHKVLLAVPVHVRIPGECGAEKVAFHLSIVLVEEKM